LAVDAGGAQPASGKAAESVDAGGVQPASGKAAESVDAGGVQPASGKAAESADTRVVSVGFTNAAGRRLDVVRRRQSVSQSVGRHA
jgi:hypothetical protein